MSKEKWIVRLKSNNKKHFIEKIVIEEEGEIYVKYLDNRGRIRITPKHGPHSIVLDTEQEAIDDARDFLLRHLKRLDSQVKYYNELLSQIQEQEKNITP